MELEQKKRVQIGIAVGVGVILLLVLLWFLFRSAAPVEELPSLVEAGRPQYNFNEASYIRENADLYLAQLVPLLGNLEGAVQDGDTNRISGASEVLERGIRRWRDALENPPLIASVERYLQAITALREAVAREDMVATQSALSLLGEIKTLVLESERSELLRLAQ